MTAQAAVDAVEGVVEAWAAVEKAVAKAAVVTEVVALEAVGQGLVAAVVRAPERQVVVAQGPYERMPAASQDAASGVRHVRG